MKIGNRVKLKNLPESSSYLLLRKNDSGFIVDILEYDDKSWMGIYFDRYIGGHDCKGAGKRGHCLYVQNKYLIVVDMIMKVKDWLREKNKPKEPSGQLFYLDIKYGENKNPMVDQKTGNINLKYNIENNNEDYYLGIR